MPTRIRSIALINPLADYGIDTYTYELGQGLAKSGVMVDAYCPIGSRIGEPELHPNHRRLNVLGGLLRTQLTRGRRSPEKAVRESVLAERSEPLLGKVLSRSRHAFRTRYLGVELALHLKRRAYDAVWTQWPECDDFPTFWSAATWLRLPLVHTVHNVLPHERHAGDVESYKTVYDAARALIVHSNPVRDELISLFPENASKTVVLPHGAYTYFRRRPEARIPLRASLAVPDNAVVLLFCGAVRPYKNIDAVIEALAALKRDDVILVVAGSESSDAEQNQLARTEALVRKAGIERSVRLLPGFLEPTAMAEMFEAADVLLLPYLKSYGSGLLMLGVTFGKYVVATRPGMEEAASRYSRAIILNDGDAMSVAAGIESAIGRVRNESRPFAGVPAEFLWTEIAARSLDEITHLLSTA